MIVPCLGVIFEIRVWIPSRNITSVLKRVCIVDVDDGVWTSSVKHLCPAALPVSVTHAELNLRSGYCMLEGKGTWIPEIDAHVVRR